MFLDFLYHLRAYGLKVSTTEFLLLMEALAKGHAGASLARFYSLARTILIKKEGDYDLFDRAFASFFEGVEDQFDIDDEMLEWLQDAKLPREITAEEMEAIKRFDWDELREEFEKRLREQKERHDGGNHWIGTGGTSPFGQGGHNPMGIRVGEGGGGRSAVAVAADRRFENLRGDRILDTRQIGTALLRLRRLSKDTALEELNVEESIDASARNYGDIELVFTPPRKNRVKLLLLMDVGGSMDPYTLLTEQLFSAANQASHFKEFKSYFFHNCIYEQLFDDIGRWRGPRTEDVLKDIDSTWTVVIVGDAYMHPYELIQQGVASSWGGVNPLSGFGWLKRIREKAPNSIWLNPEPKRIWTAPTIRLIHSLFPMFPLTLEGLTEAVDVLRGARANEPGPAVALPPHINV